jgi:hypothetical protein
MLAYEADLVDLIETSPGSINAIHRVVPPRNDRTDWVIEQVASVWRFADQCVPGGNYWLFEGAHGAQTYWPRVGVQMAEGACRELVVRLSRD